MINRDDFNSWLEHPVTQSFFSQVNFLKDDALEKLINIEPANFHNYELLMSRILGAVRALQSVLNIEFEEIEEENE